MAIYVDSLAPLSAYGLSYYLPPLLPIPLFAPLPLSLHFPLPPFLPLPLVPPLPPPFPQILPPPGHA